MKRLRVCGIAIALVLACRSKPEPPAPGLPQLDGPLAKRVELLPWTVVFVDTRGNYSIGKTEASAPDRLPSNRTDLGTGDLTQLQVAVERASGVDTKAAALDDPPPPEEEDKPDDSPVAPARRWSSKKARWERRTPIAPRARTA
jgi:hypothetical protein